MSEDIKEKEKKLIEMVDAFCEDKLDPEYKTLCNKLVHKLGRKHDVPFKRGKLENWASGIVYAIGQINYLFDKNFEPYATPDDICKYFKTKKSTASNKARDIRQMLNLKTGDKEFSTQNILDSNVRPKDLSEKTLKGAQNRMTLQMIGDTLRIMNKKRFK